MGAKSDATREKILILKDGSKHKIIGSTGRFWLCEKTQFRKSNPDIAEIVDAEEKPKKKAKKEDGDK